MPPRYRRARKYPRVLRTFRNPFRGVRRTGYRRRMMRRMMVRRPVAPEIKYAVNYLFDQVVNFPTVTTPITPVEIAQGAGRSDRIGATVRFRKVKFWLAISAPTSIVGDFLVNPDLYLRVVIWRPRVDFIQASNYMENAGYQEYDPTEDPTVLMPLDVSVLTVIKDFMVHLSPQQVVTANATTGAAESFVPSGVLPSNRIYKFVIPFPVKVKWAPNETLVDEEKYTMYMTIMSPSTRPFTYSYTSKTTYTDA